jgi:hypothetical protein
MAEVILLAPSLHMRVSLVGMRSFPNVFPVKIRQKRPDKFDDLDLSDFIETGTAP